MSKLFIANWKMNPQTEREAVALARASDAKGVVVCPPFIFLKSVGAILKKARLGAQDMSSEEKGPYTGEVSGTMLKKIGARYVIIGHSERRRHLHETDEMVNKKILAGLAAGLKIILCVGESKEVRRRGIVAAQRFVRAQLTKDLKFVSHKSLIVNRLTIAYEPIWAIGSGTPDNPKDTAVMARFIKKLLTTHYSLPTPKVLYGGSVTSANIARIYSYGEIGGVLVGGASLKRKEMQRMIAVNNNF